MVNIGGRSKGCSTCRRRRVKCDETSPICVRCQKAGLECSGPKVELCFVEATIVTSRRKANPAPKAPPATRAAPVTVASSGTDIGPPSAPLVGNIQEVYVTFTQNFLEKGGPIALALQDLQSCGVDSLRTSSAIADCRTSHLRSVLGFATIFFGTKQGLPDVTQRGYLVHGSTLQQLNRALSTPNCHQYDEIIVAVTTLAVQESLVPSGPKFFIKHMLGLEKLLALRDPSLDYSPRTVSLYRCLRHMLLIAACSENLPTIFAKPEWKAMFRRYCVSEKQLQEQRLYDILADCSVVRHKLANERKAREDGVPIQPSDVVERAQRLREQLLSWRAQWNANSTNVYVEVPASYAPIRLSDGSTHKSVTTTPTDLVFTDVSAARGLMLYNVAMLYVLHLITTHMRETQPEQPREEYAAAIRSIVLEVCRCMPGASNKISHTELHASPVFHWSVQTACLSLQYDDSAEGRWLVDLMDQKSALFFSKSL